MEYFGVCRHCQRGISATFIDPSIPWVHTDSHNAFCDVACADDAVADLPSRVHVAVTRSGHVHALGRSDTNRGVNMFRRRTKTYVPSPWRQVQEVYAVLMTMAWQEDDEPLALAAFEANVAAMTIDIEQGS